jgi:hypothetical protein
MRKVLAVFALVLSNVAAACYAPPPTVLRDHQALISEATSIIVVIVTANAGIGCSLQIVRVLKGPAGVLPLQCRLPNAGDWMTDFDGHTAGASWTQRAGRLGVNGDCSVITPAFKVGRKYVLLIGVRPDTKQFEQIAPKDKWLEFIESRVNAT